MGRAGALCSEVPSAAPTTRAPFGFSAQPTDQATRREDGQMQGQARSARSSGPTAGAFDGLDDRCDCRSHIRPAGCPLRHLFCPCHRRTDGVLTPHTASHHGVPALPARGALLHGRLCRRQVLGGECSSLPLAMAPQQRAPALQSCPARRPPARRPVPATALCRRASHTSHVPKTPCGAANWPQQLGIPAVARARRSFAGAQPSALRPPTCRTAPPTAMTTRRTARASMPAALATWATSGRSVSGRARACVPH